MLNKLFGKKKKHQDTIPKERNQNEHKRTYNVLLLGAGGSGKTTIYKQIEKAFNNDYIEEKVIEAASDDIYRNVLIDIYDLCKYYSRLNEHELSTTELKNICNEIANWQNHFILLDCKSKLTKELGIKIDKLWQDKSMQLIWKQRAATHHMDNTSYFMDKILQIASIDYVPTFEDILRVRDQTTGITIKKFVFDNEYNINIVDIGGIRAERRKWYKMFDNVDVVIYSMSLAGYNQNLFEDNTKNRMDESLELFHAVIVDKILQTDNIIVMLNKYDLLEDKLKTTPFSVYQPKFSKEYDNNIDKVIEFIKEEFSFNVKYQIKYFIMSAIDNPLDLASYNNYNSCYSVRNELLVIAYCKQNNNKMIIPDQIVNLCFKFYNQISIIQPILHEIKRL